MTTQSPRLRADALRSRERILVAAREVAARDGGALSMDEIARSAGVGNATLYRHFPNRAAVLDAIFQHQVEELARLAEEFSATMEPGEAAERWIRVLTRESVDRRGLATALLTTPVLTAETHSSEHAASCQDRILEAGRPLVDRAVAVGVFRSTASFDDVLVLVTGIVLALGSDATADAAERLIGIPLDGLLSNR